MKKDNYIKAKAIHDSISDIDLLIKIIDNEGIWNQVALNNASAILGIPDPIKTMTDKLILDLQAEKNKLENEFTNL